MTMNEDVPIDPQSTEKRRPGRPRKDAGEKPGKTWAASDLTPDVGRLRESISEEYYYWFGALPGTPVEHVTLGGVTFSKITEDITRDRDGQTGRIPRIGAVCKLTLSQIRRIADRLSRTVIRFTDDQGEKEEPGTGANLGDLYRQPRKGFLITIPTPQELALREEKGMPSRRYTQQGRDEPAARYLFCQLCSDQTRGNRGETYPPAIIETGLEWPGITE